MSDEQRRRAGWKPGQSGNPSGRPPGRGEPARLREAIAEHVPEILAQLVDAAKAGDIQASRLILERVLPPLKAAELPAPLPLPLGDGLAAQGQAVMAAAAAGEIPPGQAAALMAALGGLARVVETAELENRIRALEARAEQPRGKV